MKLFEVEVTHLCRRSVDCVMLCGDRRITDAEGQALLAEYRTEYRRDVPCVYFSRAGWQPLVEAQVMAEPEAIAPKPESPLKPHKVK